jgi:hypothetical protein
MDYGNPGFKTLGMRSVVIVVVVPFFLQMVHGAAVSFLECVAIIVDKLAFHARMPEAVVIIRILVAAGFEIPSRGFNAVVKALS